MCANLRRASRVLTQLYDDAIRPLGMRGTQFTILQALSLASEVTQGLLGEILAMDSTTLTRTLDILEGHRWISKRHGEDRREWHIRLSKGGETQLRRALPAWRNVQDLLHTQLGNEAWETLFNVTNKVTRALTGMEEKSS